MKKHLIEFVRADAPIEQPITKFGGMPVWVGEAQWPLGAETGEPMMFIGQIALDSFGFDGRMAYIFIDDSEDAEDTYQPDAGANAVIIQPDGEILAPVSTESRTDGPSLVEFVKVEGEYLLQPQPREFAVILGEEDDAPDEEPEGFDNKIGGFPQWLQFDETPGEGWTLLLQLDSNGAPFEINFGDVGVGYAFLSPDGRGGKFLWQCT